MDENGSILIKLIDKSNVYVSSTQLNQLDGQTNCLGDDIKELKGKLEMDKALTLFDIKKFQKIVFHELRSSYPDRKKLETQCVSIVAFGRESTDPLNLPCWLMVINIVALEMLKCKLPPSKRSSFINYN